MRIMIIATTLIFILIMLKYKPAYAVTQNNEVLGYVDNKDEFQDLIDKDILNNKEEKVAFVSIDQVEYTPQFVKRDLINEEEILSELKESSKNIYEVFEVSDGEKEDSIFFNTENEANEYVDEIKEEYEKIETDLSITTLYVEEEISDDAIKEAKAKITEKLDEELKQKEEEEAEQRRIESQTVNGIYLACLPVTGGSITSRYGVNESVRDHTHKGIDIAASYGTPIKAVAAGTVKYAGYYGGYGNFVVIDHGNGIETCYGHCSSINTSVGKEVEASDVIASVGSTGNSTGNHCHFEVRVNGVQVNPQQYLYK